MTLLDRIAECRSWTSERFVPLLVGDTRVGWIRDDNARWLAERDGACLVEDGRVALDPGLTSAADRSAAVAELVADLAIAERIPAPTRELYAVAPTPDAPTLFEIDRAALPFFGARAYGVHMNGFVRRADGLHLWVAKRSAGKTTFPGQLDNLVAGGQPAGLGVRENLVKECAEEADIDADLAGRAVACGAVSYRVDAPGGMRDDTLYLFDLELPEDFVPRNTDGEVESFALRPVEEVAEVVATSRAYKFNCNLVVIDFLIRHGVIGPDAPDYLELVHALRGA